MMLFAKARAPHCRSMARFLLLTIIAFAAGCGGGGDDDGGGEVVAEPAHRILVDTMNAAPVTESAGDAPSPQDGGNGGPPGGDGESGRRFRFTNISPQTGIDMTLTSGEAPASQILEVKGAGLALIDYDNDGRLDLFVPNGATLEDTEHGPGWRLFRNVGIDDAGNVRFEDVSPQAGIVQRRWALGAAVADVDADGYADLYVTCYGPNILLRNTGDGVFEDVTDRAGVAGDHRDWSTSATFGDVTGDGFLDLYVANYLEFDAADPPPPTTFLGMQVLAGPKGMAPQADALYANQRDGTFREVSESSGIHEVDPSFGLGAVILDFDQDGRQDIFVGNDSMPNFLFHNRREEAGEARLVDVGLRAGIATNMNGNAQATMGIAIGDVSGNALPDLFTTNFSSDTNTLHVNVGSLTFDDRTSEAGLGVVSRPFLGWSASFVDLDHDGREELLMVNGHVYPQATRETMDSDYRQPPLLFARGFGKLLRYDRVDAEIGGAWLDEPHIDRAMVHGDLDGDGDLDLVIGEIGGPVRVLRNDADQRDRWLIVQLRDGRMESGNRFGIGSRVELFDELSRQTRWIHAGGFLSANPATAHFGLPDETAAVRLRVTWPDGLTQELSDIEPGRIVTIERAE